MENHKIYPKCAAGRRRSARCTVEMGDGRKRVRGVLWGGDWGKRRLLCRMNDTMVTSGGEI